MLQQDFEWDEEISALIKTYPKAMQRFADKIEEITREEINEAIEDEQVRRFGR